MKRRVFITLLGGAAAWPVVARAQQPTLPVIGFLNGASPAEYAYVVAAFHKALGESGYVEGRNYLVEYRWAEGHYDRLPQMVADLVARKVAVIVANGPAVPPAKAATTTIPIIFTIGVDPVEHGFVASLNRPGGNLTGVTGLNVEMGQKRLELIHELAPEANIVAAIINPAGPDAISLRRDLAAAAPRLGLHLQLLEASTDSDLDSAFASLSNVEARAVLIGNDPFFTSRSQRVAALALQFRIPSIYQFRVFAAAGGLMSYGNSLSENYRWAGRYTGRILKGERAADLPVQQSTEAELIINLKTAKTLGLTVPATLLARADEVIE